MQSYSNTPPSITTDYPHIFQFKIMYWGPGEAGKPPISHD